VPGMRKVEPAEGDRLGVVFHDLSIVRAVGSKPTRATFRRNRQIHLCRRMVGCNGRPVF
jgi:hypothetical protein